MILYDTPAWMVFTDDAAVGFGAEDQGIPLVPACFLVKAKAEEMAEQCGGSVEGDVVGVFHDANDLLGLHTAIVDEQGQVYYVTGIGG